MSRRQTPETTKSASASNKEKTKEKAAAAARPGSVRNDGMPRAKRMIWTPQERNILAEAIGRLQEAQPGISMPNAIRLAQEKLPEDRRRPVYSWGQIRPQLEEPLRQWHLEREKNKSIGSAASAERAGEKTTAKSANRSVQEVVRVEEAPIAREMRASGDSAAQVAIVARTLADVAEPFLVALFEKPAIRAVFSGLTESISGSIARSIGDLNLRTQSPAVQVEGLGELMAGLSGLVDRLSSMAGQQGGVPVDAVTLDASIEAPPSSRASQGIITRGHDPMPKPTSSQSGPPKLKVLVAGIKPNQEVILDRVIGPRLDLRFWKNSESRDKLKKMARAADVTVGWTNFIDHAAESSMKAVSTSYVRCSGGVKSVADCLEKIIEQNSADLGRVQDASPTAQAAVAH